MVLGQIGKEAERVLVLILGRPIEANHNLREIGNRFQLLNDGGQRGRLNLQEALRVERAPDEAGDLRTRGERVGSARAGFP